MTSLSQKNTSNTSIEKCKQVMKHIKSSKGSKGTLITNSASRGLGMNRGLHHCVTSAGGKQIAVLAFILRKIMFFQNA